MSVVNFDAQLQDGDVEKDSEKEKRVIKHTAKGLECSLKIVRKQET